MLGGNFFALIEVIFVFFLFLHSQRKSKRKFSSFSCLVLKSKYLQVFARILQFHINIYIQVLWWGTEEEVFETGGLIS